MKILSLKECGGNYGLGFLSTAHLKACSHLFGNSLAFSDFFLGRQSMRATRVGTEGGERES